MSFLVSRVTKAVTLVFFIAVRRRMSGKTVFPSKRISWIRTWFPSSTLKTTFFSLFSRSSTLYCARAKR